MLSFKPAYTQKNLQLYPHAKLLTFIYYILQSPNIIFNNQYVNSWRASADYASGKSLESAFEPDKSEDGNALLWRKKRIRKGNHSWLSFPFFCVRLTIRILMCFSAISSWHSKLINLSQMTHCSFYTLRLRCLQI